MEQIPNIFLIGFMGCGKSTVAKELQELYGLQIMELDELIVQKQGMTIPDIFDKYGETYFRDLETELIDNIQAGENKVISCGGGAILREENVVQMKKQGCIVLLTAKPETILNRVIQDNNRPLLEGKKTVQGIADLIEARQEKYESAADIKVATDDKSARTVAEEIIHRIKEVVSSDL